LWRCSSMQSNQDDPLLQSNEVPRDAKIIAMLFQSMGIEQYQPRVVNQLMEFMYRYVSEVLLDAQLYMEHAGRNDMELSDIRLSIQSRVNSFTQPPPRELLLALSQAKNSIALPPIPPKFGVQLPSEEYCLVSPSYQVDPKKGQDNVEDNNTNGSSAKHLPISKKPAPDKTFPIPIRLTSNNVS